MSDEPIAKRFKAEGPGTKALRELWSTSFDGWIGPIGSSPEEVVYLMPESSSHDQAPGGAWMEAALKLVDQHGGIFGLTAFNPAGKDKPDAVNLAQNSLLEADLKELCASLGGTSTWWHSFGFSADWHEKGFIVAASRDKVMDLARKYGQGAVYCFSRATHDEESGKLSGCFLRSTVPVLLPDTEADVLCTPCMRPNLVTADPDWHPF